MFNMPPDGRVEYFYPSPSNPDEAEKDWRNNTLKERFKVDHPPYGAEHLVLIFTDRPVPELHAVLSAMKTADGCLGAAARARAGARQAAIPGRRDRYLYGWIR